MSTPPPQPGDGKPNKAKMPLDKQLDELLIGIEKIEPGTIDPAMLPSSFKAEVQKGEAEEAQTPAEVNVQAPVEAAPVEAETTTTPTEPAADATTPEQADMLAALNSALQGLGDEPPDEPAAATAPPPTADDSMSMEDKLQQEIATLMNAEPQVDAAPAPPASAEEADDVDGLEGNFASPETVAATEAAQGTRSSTEDQIAMEIESLLNTDQAEPADDTASDTAIDELDKMLAQEIDADDELAGDFHSVEDITAGIQVQDSATTAVDDEHAATARDVAAELDNQPEDLPASASKSAAVEPGEDPFAVLAEIADTAEKNEKEHQRRIAMQTPDWQRWLEVGRERLLNACYAINWPARRFLSTEWRSILGIIALMNLCTGLGFWIVLILF